ncbi:MAG: exodeoxyribonuclease VII large subunit [Clostridia bacterium]|nr:exodeoxyribonuclease VII large subunit [Clostridia bacterium]
MNTYTVAQVNKYLKKLLDNDFILSNIMVKGEISNFKKHSSGHLYFSLKDDTASMRCVMFRMQAMGLKFLPKDGDKVVITGYVSAYEKDGQCQLYCDFMQLDGVGDLYAEYEKLKEKLQKEGIFDEAHKRKLPLLPKSVAVVTSETGAVIRDILNVSLRRFPKANIKLFPSAVQGEGAYKELVSQVNLINELNCADVIIIGRGGGSLEDLWNFNSEELAYAIYNSKIPVVSAVGHETDFTICDFAADLRAPTPSAAAELVFPVYDELIYKIMTLRKRMDFDLMNKLETSRKRLERLTNSYYFKKPYELINQERLKADNLSKLLNMNFEQIVKEKQNQLSGILVKLDAMSPLKTLMRGYSIATATDGKVIKTTEEIAVGDKFNLHLSDGEIFAIREE